MHFKTIVITKNKLIAVFTGMAVITAGIITSRCLPKESISVFKTENMYEDILSESLPDSEEKSFSVKDIIGKIAELEILSPEKIIGGYSAVFGGTSTDTEAGQERTEVETEDTGGEPEAVIPTEPPMPDKAQICSSVGLKLNNATKYDVNIDSMCSEDMPFTIEKDTPQVLVMHTHTTECYDGDQMNGETERTTDDNYNVVAVGNVICDVLEENGIQTIHDTTYHDYPSYQGAYSRALTTIENHLKENPSIKIVLDIHRDAFIYEDGSKLAVTCEENGISTAQAMIVAGTDSMGLWHDNWRGNLVFASKIQNAAEIMYPGLMRPVNLRTERFNEHMTRGSLILEIGSNGNTLAQAKEGGKNVARAIAAVLNEN
ncbi:MAG: hypothetical protein HFE49_00985 [Clostridia bacterium]|nr:hypothetical protein [Clostridia bacterium]